MVQLGREGGGGGGAVVPWWLQVNGRVLVGGIWYPEAASDGEQARRLCVLLLDSHTRCSVRRHAKMFVMFQDIQNPARDVRTRPSRLQHAGKVRRGVRCSHVAAAQP